MSSKRLNTLADYARHNYKVRLDCRCGRVVLLDPHDLLTTIMSRGWASYSMEGLHLRLKCQKCGARPDRIGPGLG